MECPKCNFDNPADTNYCSNCGTQIEPSEDISASRTRTVQTPVKELNRGTTLAGRYEIIEELGRGGMGNVYRVLDNKINEEVALKLIKPVIAADKKTIERFRNELKFARKITHKNVCRMYDLNEEKETLYITMEYVPGEDLKSMIRMMGQLSVGKAISIAKQVCEGLAEAHHLGVVHRDLKPRNIMIDKEGNSRIMDFGIARSLKTKGITGTGVIVGTPEYMSPEQAEGKEVDQRSDIYSLGVILFEMMTGRVPFEGDTSLSIALKHKTEIPPDPREFNTQIPVDLSRLILRCMEKDKEKRYQGSEEFFSELSKIEEKIPSKEKVIPKRKPRVEIRRKRFQSFLLPGILFVAVIVVLVYLFLGRIMQTGEMKWRNSIAVLPVEDLSLQRDREYFCEGMTDAIITKLRIIIPELKVIPKRSVMRYKNSDKDIKEIGKELQVATILEASLQIENNTIRMTTNLSRTEDGSLLWSKVYTGTLKSFFEVQDEISKDIANPLKVRFERERFKAAKTREPTNVRAYEYYLTGKHFIEKKYFEDGKKEDFEYGMRMYEKAAKIDPDFALVYWGLGNAYESRYNREEIEEDLDLMQENYLKAYKIDPDLAETNLGLGWLYFYRKDWDEAYKFYKRAFELDPNNSQINYDIGSFFRSIGLYKKAIKYYARSIELDPLYISSYLLFARCSMHIGEFEEGADRLREAIKIDPDDFRPHYYYVRQLVMMKKHDDAEREVAIAEKIETDISRIQFLHAWIFAAKGEKEKALSLIKGMPPYLYDATSIYSLLGMKYEAIKYINEGINTGFQRRGQYLYSYPSLINNPCYDNLRDDPRFKEIVKREKNKYKEKLKKYDRL